jgi:eukaryotic-like serine/threonine-protein kinase
MANAEAEINLLFGLVALQNGLIDQQALVRAFLAWSRDRSRPLAERLIEQGGLDSDDRGAVDALVARHLKKHGGVTERSVAAIPAGRLICRQLAATDPELGATLGLGETAAAAGEQSAGDDRTTTSLTGAADIDGARFVVLRPHAKGGIGQVRVAFDNELQREVALKEIQPQLADDPGSRFRFVLEAEVTGRLEHPGVVPVYSLGADPQGRPYYAMRFIRGESFKEAIDRFHLADAKPERDPSERTLALRDLLNRLVSACNSVAYAHSRGVIHRDLKPANVMLGPYGETLVVDWGLAKVIGRKEVGASVEATLKPSLAYGRESSDTRAGTVMGTPAYMSPEQAEGRLDSVGPKSDVYSLGATLYYLLTGRSPFPDGALATVIEKVQKGDYPAPRAVNRTVPSALESICLRAMSCRPADRYTSAQALAADLEHWLADEPVTAFHEPAWTRVLRWGRRHRSLVAGGAALLLTAVAALLVGLVLLGRAGARTEQQRRRAELNFIDAERQRDLARANFQLARRAVDDSFIQVSQSTLLKSPLPGLQPLRKQLLESALKYYQEFARQEGGDPALKKELAEAYFRVGSITEELGTPPEALVAFRRALDAFQALSAAEPRNASLRGDLARTHRAIGRMEAGTGRPDDAIASFRLASNLGEELVGSNPEVPDYQENLAWSYNNLGTMLQRRGEASSARPFYNRAIATWERLIAGHPRDAFRIGLAQACSNLGWNLCQAGRLDDAIVANRKAVELNEDAARADSLNPSYRSKLAHCLDNLGTAYAFAGRTGEARQAYEKALAVVEPLIRENPAVPSFKEIEIGTRIDLGHLLVRTGEDLKARAAFETASKLAKSLPETTSSYFSHAYIHRGLAKLLLKEGHVEAALDALKKAVTIGESDPGEKPYSLYELACARALYSAVVDGKAMLTDEERATISREKDRALEALRQAVADGWENVPWMKVDRDLDPIRSRDDFQDLIRRLEVKAKYESNGAREAKSR